MTNPTMLYKCPGPHEIHGGQYDYQIVEEEDVQAALDSGWSLSTIDAKAARDAELEAQAAAREAEAERIAKQALDDATKPPTREEMEQMASNLGLPFTARTSDRKLKELIAAATDNAPEPAAPPAAPEAPAA